MQQGKFNVLYLFYFVLSIIKIICKKQTRRLCKYTYLDCDLPITSMFL